MVGFATVAAVFTATFWLPDLLQPKVHSWILGAGAIFTAISEAHFRSLITELRGLLLRPSYSAWQTDQLNQILPGRINSVWRLWAASIMIKILVGLAAAALQSDHASPRSITLCVVVGYDLLFASVLLSFYAWRSLRKTEDLAKRVVDKENQTKERNRLLKELQSGPPHDFEHDKAIQAYTKPAQNV
jgi:hypothetical protein